MTEPGNGRESDPLAPIRHSLRPPAGTEPSAACLDDETIAALAEGALDGAARESALQHVAECSRCRGTVASVARALANPLVRQELTTAGARTRRWVRRAWLPAAAAAAVLLMLVRPGRVTDEGVPGQHRDPTITIADAPVPVTPSGVAADARVFQWTSAPGASQYRLTLFDAGGDVIYETRLADTIAPLPDSIVLVPGRQYLWKVEARTRVDRSVSSPLVPFSMPPPDSVRR